MKNKLYTYDDVIALLSVKKQPSKVNTKKSLNLHTPDRAQKENISKWASWYNATPPEGLESFNPYLFKPSVFSDVTNMLNKEGYTGKVAHIYAYQISSLFKSTDRVLRYLKKWGVEGKSPLHDISYMIEMPQSQRVNAKSWGDAVLQHGPKMARLVKFSHKIEAPIRTTDKNRFSFKETRYAVAQVAYYNASKNFALAGLCRQFNYNEKQFEQSLEISLKQKEQSQDNLPNIEIEGQEFGLEGHHFKKLKNDDIRALFLGGMTDCCQYIGGAGHECVEHGFTSKESGFYVIEDNDKNIVGQAWAWRGQAGELVFDSLENSKGKIKDNNWQKLCEIFAKNLQEKKDIYNISSFHIGRGGKTPVLAFNETAKPAKPLGYKGYTDAKNQYLVQAYKAKKTTTSKV